MVRLVVLLGLILTPAALATHPSGPYVTRVANLDGDRQSERAVGWLDVDSGHTYSNWSVTIEDRCGRRWNRHKVSATWDGKLETLRVPEADGVTRRREVFYRLRLSAALGEAAIVRLDNRRPCPAPRFLFHYVAKDPEIKRFDVELGDFDVRHLGLEVRLEELSAGRDRQLSFYRYDRRAGRYVVYRSIPA